MNLDTDTISLATGLTTATLSIGWAIRALVRRINKDNTEVAKDRAEVNIIDTLQSQIATLSAENLRLRSNEAEFSLRIGKLEAKELEVEHHVEMIERLQKKLDEKDVRLEELFKTYTEETTRMKLLLEIKDKEIKTLSDKVSEMEKKFNKRIQ